mmetsp:Transcript_21640/g.30325  ORF Transcript_21640/g.30325 Transcript_21640/m.30325 type:complete len:273 (-) Transcript_21640:47-865(-)
MIRSSRIPPLLDKICTDGIRCSLLITTDGELMGCSSGNFMVGGGNTGMGVGSTNCTSATTSTTLSNKNNNANSQSLNDGVTEINKCNQESGEPSSSSPSSSSASSKILDPSDVGALVAEVVADYRHLGSTLALLNPVSNGTIHSTNNVSTNSTVRDGKDTNKSSNHNNSINNTHNSIQNNAYNDSHSQQSENTVVGKSIHTSHSNKRHGAKERGRLNCLIVELDQGLLGVSSATSDTYVVALADSNAPHGMLKARLMALADHVNEAFLQIGN